MRNASSSRGFTIIELLVVIAIIGILSTVILVSVNGARERGRDAKRIAQVQQIAKATDLYLANHNYAVPHCSSPGYSGGCDISDVGGAPAFIDSSLDGTFMEYLIADGYISETPNDPLNQSPYAYYHASGEFPNGSGKQYIYAIGTILENPNNPALLSSYHVPELAHIPNFYMVVELR